MKKNLVGQTEGRGGGKVWVNKLLVLYNDHDLDYLIWFLLIN